MQLNSGLLAIFFICFSFLSAISYDHHVTKMMDKIQWLRGDARSAMELQTEIVTELQKGSVPFDLLLQAAEKSEQLKVQVKQDLNELKDLIVRLDSKMRLLMQSRLPIYKSQISRYKPLQVTIKDIVDQIESNARNQWYRPTIARILKDGGGGNSSMAQQKVIDAFSW
jgi:hypothetical protein